MIIVVGSETFDIPGDKLRASIPSCELFLTDNDVNLDNLTIPLHHWKIFMKFVSDGKCSEIDEYSTIKLLTSANSLGVVGFAEEILRMIVCKQLFYFRQFHRRYSGMSPTDQLDFLQAKMSELILKTHGRIQLGYSTLSEKTKDRLLDALAGCLFFHKAWFHHSHILNLYTNEKSLRRLVSRRTQYYGSQIDAVHTVDEFCRNAFHPESAYHICTECIIPDCDKFKTVMAMPFMEETLIQRKDSYMKVTAHELWFYHTLSHICTLAVNRRQSQANNNHIDSVISAKGILYMATDNDRTLSMSHCNVDDITHFDTHAGTIRLESPLQSPLESVPLNWDTFPHYDVRQDSLLSLVEGNERVFQILTHGLFVVVVHDHRLYIFKEGGTWSVRSSHPSDIFMGEQTYLMVTGLPTFSKYSHCALTGSNINGFEMLVVSRSQAQKVEVFTNIVNDDRDVLDNCRQVSVKTRHIEWADITQQPAVFNNPFNASGCLCVTGLDLVENVDGIKVTFGMRVECSKVIYGLDGVPVFQPLTGMAVVMDKINGSCSSMCRNAMLAPCKGKQLLFSGNHRMKGTFVESAKFVIHWVDPSCTLLNKILQWCVIVIDIERCEVRIDCMPRALDKHHMVHTC